jgi:hypothetical protein
MNVHSQHQCVGLLLGIVAGERLNKRKVSAACMLGHMVGVLMLTFAAHPIFLVGFAIFHGLSWGLNGPLIHAMPADYFGVRAIA